jgi:integrase
MAYQRAREPTGVAYRVERRRGDQWYVKYRLPDGRQVQKRLGPAWTERGRPPAGFLTKRTAEAALRDILDEARKGTLAGMVRTDATFSDACDEYLRWIEFDRQRKASTLLDYRSAIDTHLRPAFGTWALEDIATRDVEQWRDGMRATGVLSNRTMQKLLTVFHGVMERARRHFGLLSNPVSDVERPRPATRLEIDVLSPEEVMQLVDAAASEQDAAIFLTAAFTGLRQGELIALRWQDVDFAGATIRVTRAYTHEQLTTPKSGKSRAVPLAPEVASRLRALHGAQGQPAPSTLVFPGPAGSFMVARLLGRRYLAALERADLRRLRFHDLRHTFGTRMVGHVDLLELREMMGHGSITTTERYLHYKLRQEPAEKVAAAFKIAG